MTGEDMASIGVVSHVPRMTQRDRHEQNVVGIVIVPVTLAGSRGAVADRLKICRNRLTVTPHSTPRERARPSARIG
jgi:hypothetical protein